MIFFKKIIDLNDPVQDTETRVYKPRVELSFQCDSFVIFVLCRNLGMIPSHEKTRLIIERAPAMRLLFCCGDDTHPPTPFFFSACVGRQRGGLSLMAQIVCLLFWWYDIIFPLHPRFTSVLARNKVESKPK